MPSCIIKSDGLMSWCQWGDSQSYDCIVVDEVGGSPRIQEGNQFHGIDFGEYYAGCNFVVVPSYLQHEVLLLRSNLGTGI